MAYSNIQYSVNSAHSVSCMWNTIVKAFMVDAVTLCRVLTRARCVCVYVRVCDRRIA